MVFGGFGIGVCLIGSITSAQNALSAQDIGVGTSALLVLRSVGGATGSTLAGAIIGAGLSGVAGAGLVEAAGDLGWNFAMIYVAAGLLAATAFLTALVMPNTPLRGS
jgi:hypothetical protein